MKLALHRIKTAATRAGNKLRGRRNVHLLHIGKTGGTAIKNALRLAVPSQTSIILHPHQITLTHIPPGDGFVFFVRDPIARFVSGFFSRKRKGFPAHDKGWSMSEQAAFSRFPTPDALASSLESEAADTRAAAVQAMQSIEHVRSTYWDWFINRGNLTERRADIVFVGQQESLTQDFEQMKQMLELPQALALPADPANAHTSPAGEDRELSDQARENLSRWYAQDYDLLDICAEWRSTVLERPFEYTYCRPLEVRPP
ncbi:MAG: sulfotransferase family 2 domain-containing protein [Pseudomonadota bacterium]